MEIDYEKVGLKCGLEIHQQLDTKKLFCNCPSLLRQDEPDFEIKRKLHVVAGETGEIDAAAGYEASLKKTYNYQGYDTTCLIELDEEPPLQINEDALKVALQISILLNCKIIPIAQIMRKTVIDGSNTSGFQRTILIAREGFVQTNFGEVKIQTVCLEEDSARIVEPSYTSLAKLGKEEDSARIISQGSNVSTYRLDRLGIPLIEIATSADIKHPIQAKEVALFIGNVLRSCNVKRGIGTIRQDVNVSVKDGNRIEIKGVQEPWLIEKAVEMEAKRQVEIIRSKKTVVPEVRRVLENGETVFLRPMPGAARMYPETDLPLLKISRDFKNKIKKNLPKLKHETEKELKETGLHEEMIKLIFKENKLEEFKILLKVLDNPNLVAKILTIYPREISNKYELSIGKVEKLLDLNVMEFILSKLRDGKISETQVKSALEKIIQGENPEKAIIFEKHDVNMIEEKIVKIIKQKPGLTGNAYMGLIMKNKEFKGKISGNEIMKIIKKYVH